MQDEGWMLARKQEPRARQDLGREARERGGRLLWCVVSRFLRACIRVRMRM